MKKRERRKKYKKKEERRMGSRMNEEYGRGGTKTGEEERKLENEEQRMEE